MKLLWLPRAIADRNKIIDFIANDKPLAAIKQGDLIIEKLDQLIDYPDLGRKGRQKSTFELVIMGTPYIAVYRLKKKLERIEVIRVLHGSQKYP